MNKKPISEATGAGSTGHYKVPINLAPKIWKKDSTEPFTIPVSDYLNPYLAYDSYDGDMETDKKTANKMEKRSEKMAKMSEKLFMQNDGEGNPFNGYSPDGNPRAGTPDYIKKQADLPKSEYEQISIKKNNKTKMVSHKSQNEELRKTIKNILREHFT